MQKSILGWDIGGAHIKAVVLEPNAQITQVFQYPCPLWKGMDYLYQAVNQVLSQLEIGTFCHVITMTGELVDLFDGRDQGVEHIILAMEKCLPDQELLIYAGVDGFLTRSQVKKQHYAAIASANWLASSTFAAKQIKNALFVDIGSTTTDILTLSEGKVASQGFTDFDRLVSGELVYTGIIRTTVMAVAQSAYFLGQEMGLMAEYFATMADVYRLTGELNEAHDQIETADGAEKTLLASARRLSRMTGYEFCEQDLALWKQFALTLKAQHKSKIQQACARQLSRNLLKDEKCLIGAGVGRFLAKQIAADLNYQYIDFTELAVTNIPRSEMDIADCAPAASVALLAQSL